MKKTKKWLVMGLSALALTVGTLGVTACGDSTGTVNSSGGSSSEITQTEDNEIRQVYNMYVSNAQANGETPLSYEMWLLSIRGEKGDQGAQGVQGEKGEDGDDGEDGLTPYIGANGNWWIGTTDTGISATGAKGDKGDQGAQGEKGEDGKDGEDGEDGLTPYIGANGNWWIGTTDTGISATGAKGDKGDQGIQGEKGDKGEQGVGIEKVEYDKNGNLVITFTDGTKQTVAMPEQEVHTHNWGEGIVLKEATREMDGVMIYVCDCGEAKHATLSISKGLKYTLNKDGESYSVTGIGTCMDTDIIIPSTYEGLPVTTIGNSAFYNCDSLTSVEIPNSVTEIGFSAFSDCNSLTSVEIPNSVKTIQSYAFEHCNSLTSVEIPKSVTLISDRVFNGCDSLTSITVDKNNSAYQSIDGNLYNKAGTMLIQYAIGKTATEFVIPNGVTRIGAQAFAYCYRLTNVVIGGSVTMIGEYVFIDCYSLTSITVDKNNSAYQSIDGNLYNKDGTTLIQYAIGKTATEFVIPNGVTTIGFSAFYGCYNLTSVVIPDSVTTIGDCAFEDCDSLTSVVIPDSVTTIGSYAFSDCDSLTSVVIPDSVTSIGYEAFYSCDRLTDVYYKGTESDWSKISIGSSNSKLTSATRYYYSESKPTTSGAWWHYVDGVPTKW